MLDEWKIPWALGLRPKSQFEPNTLAAGIADCDWYLAFGVAEGACFSSSEVEQVKEMGRNTAWSLPMADLLCYVEEARFGGGFLLTHCRPVPVPMDIEVYREEQRQALSPPVDFEP
jgi:hypothetical protein